MNWLNLHKIRNISVNGIIAVLTVSFILFCGAYFYCQHFLEPMSYDFMVKLTAKTQASKDIVEIVIDDQSVNKIGRWPWNRRYYSDIFYYLENQANAKAVAFDSVILSYGDKSGDNEFFNRTAKLKKTVFGMFFSKQANYFNNRNAISDKILKQKFSIQVKDTRPQYVIKDSEYKSSSYTLKELLSSVNGLGSVLSHPDNDGIIRKIEPIYLYNNDYYPSLGLKVYSLVKNEKDFQLSNNFLLDNYGLKIPVASTNQGVFNYIKWYKPVNIETANSHQVYSAWKVLESFNALKSNKKPILSPSIFKNKIVVVGATATALKDYKATSISSDHPGVDIQATVIDNIIHNDFIQKISPLYSILILVLVLALALISIIILSPLYSSIVLALLMTGYFELCLFSYQHNIAIDVITPQVFIIFSLIIGYGYKYIAENNEKHKIQKVMAKYVSKDVLTNIMKNIDNVKLGGKRAEVTVLFADIRGFTTLAETMEPEEVSALLNEYFGEVVPIILNNGGMLDKFMGDAILAVFGTPIESSNHPMNAIKCAVQMLEKVKQLRRKWESEGKPSIDIGIGINSGIVFAGNVGSVDRLEYTVVGDTVNLASRLESFNKLFNTKLLISSSTYEKVKENLDVIMIHSVDIKGKTEPVNIYEVINFIKKAYDPSRETN